MAKFKSPLGVVQGGYGNLVTYCVKGQNRVRSKPLEYHDANTPEQQKARRRICIVSRFYSKLKETPIIDIWKVAAIPTPHDRYSLFRKVNTNVFLPNGKIGDFSNLHMAQGSLPQVLNMQISIDPEDNVTLTWTNHLEYITSYDNSRLGIIAIYSHRVSVHDSSKESPQSERTKSRFARGPGNGKGSPSLCIFLFTGKRCLFK